MSHQTKSTRRNPALSFFKSLKPSESVPTSPTYFGSRLFRGKSPSSATPGHLTALRDLNALKSNPKIQALPYSELCKLITVEDKSAATPKIKFEKSATALFSASKDYSSLSPDYVREDMTKRKNKHSLPSEKRLILIDQYISQTEAVHTRGSFSTLKNVWHQTLSNPAKQHSRSLKNSFNGTKKNFFSMIKDLNGSTMAMPNFTDRLPEKKATEISSTNKLENMGRDRVYTSMDDLVEDTYNTTTQQMESLANSIKDFHKILSHTQGSYKKAQEQQNNLSIFVSTFIKEVEQTEKNAKMLNVGKLNICVTSLESKIEELASEKELISEQLERIYDLINIQSAKKEAALYSPPTSLPKNPHLDIDFSDSPQHRPSVSIGNSPVSVKPRGSIDHIQSKTSEIKDDVKKLQIERLEHQGSIRAHNVKLVRAKSREATRTGESPKSDLFYKLPKDMSPQEKQSAPKDLFLILGPDSRNDLNFNLDGDSDTRRDSGNKYTRKVRLSISGNNDNPTKELAIPLYGLYRKTLGQLEDKLKEKLSRMSVFQKDVDEENSSDIELLTQQIRECFDQFVDDFKGLTKDVDHQLTSFLINIAQNYEKFLGLANSNVLKVTSMKNIVLASVDKLRKLEKLAGKYTALELTDKMIRKEYDTEHRALKQELQSDKKTLMFLIEQLDHSIYTYQINPIQNPSSQDASRLVDQSKMLVRVLYNLEKFPLLEEEFNEKTTTAYMKCKTTGELIIWLKEFRNTGAIISAEKYKEADETMKTLESLHIRVVALQNEMSMISKLDIFQELAAKPLLIVTKLVKKMSGIQKELKGFLDSIKQDLISHYNELISQADDIYGKLDSNIKRISSHDEHLNFFLWKQNHTVINILREETIKLKVEIGKYTVEKYPSSVALIPHPMGKKQQLESLEKVSDCLLSTLITGKLFESWRDDETFTGFKSNTLKQKLCDAYLKLQDELMEKEKAKVNLGRESELIKSLISDVIKMLSQLKTVLSSSFDLEDRVNKEYHDFQEEHLSKDLYLLNPNALFENPIVSRYPKLMSAKTIERFDTFDFKTGNTSILIDSGGSSPVSPMRDKTYKRQVTSGLVRTLPVLENPEGEYPKQMAGFVERMKWVFEDFYEHNVIEYTTQHPVFKEIHDMFRKMGSDEITLLEQVQRAVYNVQVNHIFYNQEIRPLTNVPKYLYVLNNWSNKVGNLTIIRESMKSCLNAITVLEGETIMRGGIELQIMRYKQIQSMVSNSVNIVIDLLSLGTQLNDKTMATLLGHSLRIEEGGLKEFVKILDRRLKYLYETYHVNSELIEEDTRTLLENLQEFLEKLVQILHLAESKYSNIFRIISDGLRPHNGILGGYVDELYSEMKGFADDFCDRLNEIAKLALKPTWLIKILDVFYQDIVLKDLSVFSRLSEDGKKITMFIKEFKEEFVHNEIKELAKYKKIHESDPTHCDKYIEKCNILSKALNDFLTTEEILCRPELKNTLSQKLKEIQAIKKVLSVFGMVYSMGRKLNDNFIAITEQKTIIETYDKVVKLDGVLGDMVNHLFRELEGAKLLDKDCTSLSLGMNLEAILKTDILVFYSQTRKCMNNLNEYLNGIAEFYQELRKKYKNQVLLLRDDWVDFIKEWVSTYFVTLGRKVNAIDADYPEFKERLQVFLKDLEAKIKNSKYVFIETMKRVEYLNEYFFNEWFFNFSEEEKDVADKLLPRMKKLIKNIRLPKYKTSTKLRQKIKKMSDLVERCDKCIKELANKGFISTVFEGIKGWNVVAEYHGRKNIGAWKQVIEFAMNELVAPEPGQQPKQCLKEKPESIEALYEIAEKQLQCSLTEVQKDFLESIYSLPLEGH